MSLLLKELSSTKDLRKVSTLQLGIFDPNLIKRGSVCEVLTAETYDGNDPKINGLFDPRMGVIDDGRLCASCENKRELCPGHFGHIELTLPVFHIHFVSQILKLLQCVCFRCSKLLIDKTDPIFLEELIKKSGKNRFATIYNAAQKVKTCKHNNGCHVMQPSRYYKVSVDKIKEKDNIIKIFAEFKQEALKSQTIKRQQMVSPELCYEILRRVSNEDCNFLGFSHTYARPEWMICTILPVPPPQVRPSVKQDNNQRSEDDLTFALAMIVKANNMLRDKIKAQCAKTIIESYHGLLQYMIATYIDNELPGVPQSAQRSRRALKTIIQRLKGKEGRFRGNLMGKRVDFSARTVISVDPNIDIDEFGVPEKLAMTLTFPEIVTKHNIKNMYKLLRNGPHVHPGAVSVKKMKNDCFGNPAPCTTRLEYVDPSSIILSLGDVVNRHIDNGDVCLFNRQPSLHRMSMMGHKVRVIKFDTFRLNVLVCKPYNADFDGDEMNMHVPQSYETMYELKHITLVPTQIISPATSKPVIGIVQDTLVGSYLMTADNVRINRQQLQNYIMSDKEFNGIIPDPAFPKSKDNPEDLWTGRQVFSLIVPEVTLKKDDVFIKNGIVLSGKLGKNILGTGAGGLIQFVYNQYGVDTCKNFLDNIQKVVTRWLTTNGFSIGFGDAIVDHNINVAITDQIQVGLDEVNKLIEEAHEGVYKPNLNKKYMMESLDSEIKVALNTAVESVSSIVQKVLPESNSFNMAVKSGSKGSAINLNQIMGCVGQQIIWGDRVPFGFTDRTLPHFHKLDNGAMSRGFVKNSYISGLSPTEFFFSAMGGRVGLIDTAIKTAESGYIQRRLVKATEDLKICYDSTVRNTVGNIVQFVYGDDGMDPIKIEMQKLDLIELDDYQIEHKYKLEVDELLTASILPSTMDELVSTPDYDKILDNEFNIIRQDRDTLRYSYFKSVTVLKDVSFLSPVNYYRLIPATLNKFSSKPFDVSDLNPIYIIEQVTKLCDDIDKYSNSTSPMHLFKILTRTFLSSKNCILTYKLSKMIFDYLINIVRNKVLKSYIQAGELVGPLAAQSIGEPLTQMSSSGEEEIMIYNSNTQTIKKGKLNDIVEKMINENKMTVINDNSSITPISIEDKLYILSVSYDEKVKWSNITELSRHKTNGNLVKITTRSGRETTATLSHSFLKRTVDKIVPVLGKDLKIGNRVPVSKQIPIVDNIITCVKLSDYIEKLNHESYEFKLTRMNGFFIGAYLSEGSINSNTITISNIYKSCINNILDFVNSYSLDYTTNKSNSHNRISISFKSEEFTSFLTNVCGIDSRNKKIPDFSFAASKEFITGIINGYFNGKGVVSSIRQMLRAYSPSKQLIQDMCLLLSYIGMYAIQYPIDDNKTYKLIVPGKFAKIFLKEIGNDFLFKRKELEKLVEYFESIEGKNDMFSNKKVDKIPELGDIITRCNKILELSNSLHHKLYKDNSICRKKLQKYIELFQKVSSEKNINIREDIEILIQAAYSDVLWDEIIAIEIIEDTGNFVYDFTVNGTNTFMLNSGILVHNTLNTFHLAGVGSVVTTSGVPRIKEIVNISKKIKTPSVSIYLKDEYATDQNKALTIMKQLEYTRLEDVVIKSQIIYEKNISSSAFNEDIEFVAIYHEFNEILDVDVIEESNLSKWVLRFEFDKEAMMNRSVHMSDVQEAILLNCNSDNDIQCIFSDDNSGHLILRIRIRHDTDDGNYVSFLQELEKCIMGMTLRGIPHIGKVSFIKQTKIIYDSNGKGEEVKEVVLKTDGTNLLEILNNEYVDSMRTITNDIYEIFEIFGIEGARSAIINELSSTITDGSSHVDYRHVALLADTMTYKGSLMQIDRHGINRSADTGPIAKASFEEVSDILISAASFAEKDRLNGVSGNIVMGQVPHAGTNSFDIMFDEQKLMASEYPAQNEDDEDEDDTNIGSENVMTIIDETFKESSIEQDINDSSFEFGYSIESMQEYKLSNKTHPPVNIKIIGGSNPKKISISKKTVKTNTNKQTTNTEEVIKSTPKKITINKKNIKPVESKNIENVQPIPTKIIIKPNLKPVNIQLKNNEELEKDNKPIEQKVIKKIIKKVIKTDLIKDPTKPLDTTKKIKITK